MSGTPETLETLWAYCCAENRVCPMPPAWTELFGKLKNTHQKPSGGWEPPLPLILAVWHGTAAIEKQLRLKTHLEWANAQGQIETIGTFVRSLPEKNWLHLGEN